MATDPRTDAICDSIGQTAGAVSPFVLVIFFFNVQKTTKPHACAPFATPLPPHSPPPQPRPPPLPHGLKTEAKVAAVRADYDAKVAELMADLEATRGEKEQIDSELIFLKVSRTAVARHFGLFDVF